MLKGNVNSPCFLIKCQHICIPSCSHFLEADILVNDCQHYWDFMYRMLWLSKVSVSTLLPFMWFTAVCCCAACVTVPNVTQLSLTHSPLYSSVPSVKCTASHLWLSASFELSLAKHLITHHCFTFLMTMGIVIKWLITWHKYSYCVLRVE
jgi:hypothetical protein